MIYMKWSIFNYKQHVGDNYRIYNTNTRGIIELSVHDYELISKMLEVNTIEDDACEAVKQLAEQGFISGEDDEWNTFIKARTESYHRKNGRFVLYFVPSWDCDFRCPYCHYYELVQNCKKDNIVSIEKNAHYAAKYIDELYKEFHKTIHLSVILYGGEPLLAIDSHLKFLKYLKEFIANKNIILSTSVITNGYNLTDMNIKALKDWNLRGMQITVDGLPDVHNKRRMHKSGVETFDRIVNNIKKLCMVYNIPVTLRINVDSENVAQIPALLKHLRAFGISKNLLLSVSPVFSNSNVDGAIMDPSVLSEFSKIYEVAAELQYPFVFPTTACSYYSAEFLVLANDKAYSCPSMSANDIEPLSAISENPIIMDRALKVDAQCEGCLWYPLCGGGCKYQNMVHGATQCMKITYQMIIENYSKKYSQINRLVRG